MGSRADTMAKDAGIRLLLVRSGPTAWDAGGRLQGAADLPLSETGRAETETFVRSLGRVTLATVYCAPDEASIETGRLLAGLGRRLASRVQALPELADPHAGLWEGLRQDELEDRYPRAWGQFVEDACCVTPPEGETVDSLHARMMPVLSRAIAKARAGSRVCVVVRPLALGVLRCRLNGLPITEAWRQSGPASAPEWYDVDKNDPRLSTIEQAPAATAA
ncbi:MAG: histidine phosphatase family protein [Phycisphaeraceae bacterium]|nr:histidine phosphatase family protein [Phycisphaeraceae bacterium]